MTPFDELKEMFPIWELRNKASHAVQLELVGGNSVQFGPNASRKVRAADMHQLPSPEAFVFVSPSMSDMIEIGLIKRTVPVKATPQASVSRIAPAASEKE